MKISKIKLLFITLLSISLWSCSNEAVDANITTEAITSNEVEDHYYDYEQGDDVRPYSGKENLGGLFLLDVADNVATDNSQKAGFLEGQEAAGGHTLARHWDKTVSYLLSRNIKEATTFASHDISYATLNNLLQNAFNQIRDKAPNTVGATFTRDFTFAKVVGHGIVGKKKTLYHTKKFRMVIKRISTFSALSTVVLTCYPIL
jgi:hypothetical protein